MIETCKDKAYKIEVDIEAAGQRLDNFLMRIARDVPKSHIYRVIRSGEVRVNSKRVNAQYRLTEGDSVRIPPLVVAPVAEKKFDQQQFSILFEDDTLLVVDKPAGVAVHGGSGLSFGVIEQLRKARPQARFLELAHRLDRSTSGALVLAKRRTALTALHQQFRSGSVVKNYQAVVCGKYPEQKKRIRHSLLKYIDTAGERRVRVSTKGKDAHTVVQLLEVKKELSFLAILLKTGRTHQIRVHLAHEGFPILGDDKYGDAMPNQAWARQGLRRMFLHAHVVTIKHPLTGSALECISPLPKDWETLSSRCN